jgi:hypothetical protein
MCSDVPQVSDRFHSIILQWTVINHRIECMFLKSLILAVVEIDSYHCGSMRVLHALCLNEFQQRSLKAEAN